MKTQNEDFSLCALGWSRAASPTRERRRCVLVVGAGRFGFTAPRRQHAVQRRFRQMLIQLVHEDLSAMARSSPQLEATTRYVAGALLETLTWWLETRNGFRADEIEKLFKQLTGPVLGVLRKGG